MSGNIRRFAIVTGASTGIGYELARQCIQNGFDVLIAADVPEIEQAARSLRSNGVGALFAFVLSMFSLDGIRRFLTAALVRLGNTNSTTPDEKNDMVVKLPGVDEAIAETLRAEGIDTIAQLTAVDPVRVSVVTGLPFEYVLEIIDAAALWRFFAVKTPQLQEFGFRGASAFLIYDDFEDQSCLISAAGALITADAAVDQAADRAAAMSAVTNAANALRTEAMKGGLFQEIEQATGIKVAALRNVAAQIRQDAYITLIRNLLGTAP